jgi:hypothetical protein
MAAVEHVGDVVDAFGPRGGVAGGGAQVDVAEPCGDLVYGHAGLQEVGGPVGPERVRVRQPLRYSSAVAVAAHEPVHRDRGEGERFLVAVAAEPDEQRLLVEQGDGTGERVGRSPRLNRLLYDLGHGDLTFAPTLPSHIEAVVAGVGSWPAQVPGPKAAQFRGPQATVAQDPQEA